MVRQYTNFLTQTKCHFESAAALLYTDCVYECGMATGEGGVIDAE